MNIDQAFTHFPNLDTERLHLRQIRPEDAEALFAIRSDPQVTEPYGLEPYQSLANAQTRVQKTQALYEQQKGLLWCITLKGSEAMIGSCSLFHFDHDAACAEIGYELNRTYWRQGITAETISAILDYSFHELNLHRVDANVGADNISSRNLLIKLGFVHEGTLRQHYITRGQYEDQLCFGLLRDEWLTHAEADR